MRERGPALLDHTHLVSLDSPEGETLGAFRTPACSDAADGRAVHQSRSTACPVSASTRLIASDGQEAAASRNSSGSVSASTGPDRCRSSRTNRSGAMATHMADPMHKLLSTEIFQRLMAHPTGPVARAGCGSPFPV